MALNGALSSCTELAHPPVDSKVQPVFSCREVGAVSALRKRSRFRLLDLSGQTGTVCHYPVGSMEPTTIETSATQPLQLLVSDGKNAKYVKGDALQELQQLQSTPQEAQMLRNAFLCSLHRSFPGRKRCLILFLLHCGHFKDPSIL